MKKSKQLFIYLIITLSLIIILFITIHQSSKEVDNNPWYFSSLNIKNNNSNDNIVCLIDSGFSGDGFNKDNIIDCYNVFDNSSDVNDECGHGTSMLSLLIGYDDGINKIIGINTKCKVVIVKAVDNNGYATPDNVAKAITYSSKYENSIINISLGTYTYNENLHLAVENAKSRGCIIVASSGDDRKNDLMYPAKFDDVLAITCQAKNGKKYIYANDDEKSIFVPGVNVNVFGLDTSTEKFEIYSTSGSSISTIIFSAIISKIDLNLHTIDYDYLKDCKTKNLIIDTEKIVKQK